MASYSLGHLKQVVRAQADSTEVQGHFSRAIGQITRLIKTVVVPNELTSISTMTEQLAVLQILLHMGKVLAEAMRVLASDRQAQHEMLAFLVTLFETVMALPEKSPCQADQVCRILITMLRVQHSDSNVPRKFSAILIGRIGFRLRILVFGEGSNSEIVAEAPYLIQILRAMSTLSHFPPAPQLQDTLMAAVFGKDYEHSIPVIPSAAPPEEDAARPEDSVEAFKYDVWLLLGWDCLQKYTRI